jgi:zinc/manganese transport system permease protein
MLSQEFMRNALLAGTFVALACGVCGWFLVLRAQVFAGDALGHVAFPGALAAAAAGIDERVGLFLATVLVAVAIGLLGRETLAGGGAPGSASGGDGREDTVIGIVFTFVLGLGVLFLTLFSRGAGGAAGVEAAHTLFGSIFGLSAGQAHVAAAIGAAATLALAAIARPLLFATVTPEAARALGVRTRVLDLAFLVLLAVVVAEAAQAVGALLLLALIAAPALAAHRLAPSPLAGLALAGALGVACTWAGLVLAYAVPSVPPSTAIVGVAVAVAVTATPLAAART